MGIIKRTVADITRDAKKAQAAAVAHETSASNTDAEVQRLEAEAVNALIEDPNRADEIGRRIDAQTRLANAYRAKARTKRQEVEDLKQEALAVEATDLEKEGVRLDREAEKQAAKVEALVKQLEELDGIPYVREPEPPLGPTEGARYVRMSRTEEMEGVAHSARLRAKVNRYYLQFGQPPLHSAQLLGDMTLATANAAIPGTRPLDPEASRSPLLRGILAGTWPESDTAA